MRKMRVDSPFARGINKLAQMLYAGVLWFLFSIPVITAGAASEALYEILLKLEKDQENYIGASFIHAFRKNLKSATLVWIPVLTAEIVFGVNLFYYAVLGGGHFPVQSMVFAVLLLFALIVSGYVYPAMARFENTAAGTFRFALALAVRNPGWTAVIVLIRLFTVFVCWFFLFFPLLFIMGISGYFQAVIFNYIFDGLIGQGKIIETGERNDKDQGKENE